VALMTEDDHYQVHVYPKAHKITLVFIGDCWEYNKELTYNSSVLLNDVVDGCCSSALAPMARAVPFVEEGLAVLSV